MSAPMRQRGMALLSVLLLTAVMTVLAVAMLDDIRFGLRRTGNAHAIAQAQRYALGSEALARQRLGELQRGGVDAARWNGQPLLFPIVEDGQTLGLVRARLGDGSTCFNLNSVVGGAPEQWQRRELGVSQYVALLQALGFAAAQAQTLADTLTDWIDSDGIRESGGAEDEAYLAGSQAYRTGGTLLAEVSELIIRRMRTGVVLVGSEGDIRLANEAAMLHLGEAGDGHRSLATTAPALARRLQAWQASGHVDPTPLTLQPDLPEVLPRFTRLLGDGDQVLVFLDDAELASRRAETLTLATLGRFSASLAHEIRNPLAAISYATQLLEESHDIVEGDRRLLEIIHQQTLRMNGIIENVLGLARRERAQPQHVELGAFAREFVDDWQRSQPLEQATLEARAPSSAVMAMVDRKQLQQVVTVLVHNALVYGRLPGQTARIALHVHLDDRGAPLLDVTDRGPGIPDQVAPRLFSPFHTTSEHGTGLGLYIARELCLANQAHLAYVPVPAGGACFRIRLAGVRAIETRTA